MDEPDTKIISIRVESPEDEALDELDALPKRNPFMRGSDPRVATCRGRLQNRRCQLNQEINKELRLRAGAENLFKATTNRKLRETVALELSFVNSNLQLLKEQLAELNSSVELYQSDSKECVMPMIPLGLKETKEVDFREPFNDFILEHYSEDAAAYEEPISDFMDMRQAMRTPSRSAAGVALLFNYYNQLYFIERRFFPPDRSLGVYFEWFDSLTGVPSCQRTVAFEKACVLFNMAGIYTQIGAKQERHTAAGLDGSVDALLRAAGTLRYIHENFTNAPSVDLAADTLDVLVNLMMAQARECLFEKLQLQAREECASKELELCDDLELCLDLCQESAQLNCCYATLYQKMQSDAVFHYVPYSWVSLVHVKTEFYKGLAHHYCATGLLNIVGDSALGARVQERLVSLHAGQTPAWQSYRDTRGNGASGERDGEGGGGGGGGGVEERTALGKAHLREATTLYEEALRLQRMCRELRAKEPLVRVLRQHYERAAREAAALTHAHDYNDLLDPPQILPSSKFQLSLTTPDFAQHRVEDLFKSLGPVAIFSAKRHWSAPRLIQLQKYTDRSHHVKRDSVRKSEQQRQRQNGNSEQSDGEILRNGLKALRSNGYERRDHSEDNRTYYNQILRSDEKYTDKAFVSDMKKKLNRVTKQNGVYINTYNNNNNYDCQKHDCEQKNNKNTESFVKTSTENGFSRLEAKRSESICGNDKLRDRKTHIKHGDSLRRVSSDYNVSTTQRTNNEEGFGFSVRGDAPVIIAGVEPNSLADVGGMREGDFIVAIGERDVKWSSHAEVVRLIQQSPDTLNLKLVTPMDRNYLKAAAVEGGGGGGGSLGGGGSVSAASTASSGSAGAGATPRGSARRAPNWNPFRRHHARDASAHRASHAANVIFR